MRTADCSQWERKRYVGGPEFDLGYTEDTLSFPPRNSRKLRVCREVKDDTGH